MLDTGNLYDLATNPNKEEWTSQTWEIDWENNRLLSKRINGKEAVAQGAIVSLCVDYQKFPIFSNRFGNEFYKFIGQDRELLKCNAERLVKEALAPDLRIDRVTNFTMQDLDKYTLGISFTIECADGSTDVNWEVLLG